MALVLYAAQFTLGFTPKSAYQKHSLKTFSKQDLGPGHQIGRELDSQIQGNHNYCQNESNPVKIISRRECKSRAGIHDFDTGTGTGAGTSTLALSTTHHHVKIDHSVSPPALNAKNMKYFIEYEVLYINMKYFIEYEVLNINMKYLNAKNMKYFVSVSRNTESLSVFILHRNQSLVCLSYETRDFSLLSPHASNHSSICLFHMTLNHSVPLSCLQTHYNKLSLCDYLFDPQKYTRTQKQTYQHTDTHNHIL